MRIVTLATFATLLPLAAALAAPPAGTLAKVDQTFIEKAAQGGMTEVQEGQAAATSATTPDLKAYAQKMVDAHTPNNDELAKLAASKGVTVPTTLDAHHQKQLDMLTKKTGPAFDKAYMKDQTSGHEAMEKVMKKEIDDGKDADLKAFATKTLPVVQDHLNSIKSIKTAS